MEGSRERAAVTGTAAPLPVNIRKSPISRCLSRQGGEEIRHEISGVPEYFDKHLRAKVRQ